MDLIIDDKNQKDKDRHSRSFKNIKQRVSKLLGRRSITISDYDPTYKVVYLGNVLTTWARGDGCFEKPLNALWKNYKSNSKADVQMKLIVTQSGLKAVTKEHGLTEYWSHRITYSCAPTDFPKIFCWVYRHEGRKLKQELRCHAVLCSKESAARTITNQLQARLHQALMEFKRDKINRQNARLSLANCVYENPSLPRRKIMLSTGSHNYRPPLERSKSAPRLKCIEECLEEEEEKLDCKAFSKQRGKFATCRNLTFSVRGNRLGGLYGARHRASIISDEAFHSMPASLEIDDIQQGEDDDHNDDGGDGDSSQNNGGDEQQMLRDDDYVELTEEAENTVEENPSGCDLTNELQVQQLNLQ